MCGLGAPTAGFMQIDRQGKWAGLSVDICRAVATAILRDASKVKYVSLAAAQAIPSVSAIQLIRAVTPAQNVSIGAPDQGIRPATAN